MTGCGLIAPVFRHGSSSLKNNIQIKLCHYQIKLDHYDTQFARLVLLLYQNVDIVIVKISVLASIIGVGSFSLRGDDDALRLDQGPWFGQRF